MSVFPCISSRFFWDKINSAVKPVWVIWINKLLKFLSFCKCNFFWYRVLLISARLFSAAFRQYLVLLWKHYKGCTAFWGTYVTCLLGLICMTQICPVFALIFLKHLGGRFSRLPVLLVIVSHISLLLSNMSFLSSSGLVHSFSLPCFLYYLFLSSSAVLTALCH